MATPAQCRKALENLATKLKQVDEKDRKRHAFDRTLSCHVPDLGITFSGALEDGHIVGITTDPAPRAQIRLTAQSDDLVAMTDGHLSFGQAWLAGRVKVEAGVRDLLKLRSML
ncbi:MAG TPA: sterol-binding protein [Actinomycetes bacterium]|nr:sterol-binding protein [Actinomycetes bacterium]